MNDLKHLIERYIQAYNTFDIDGMMSLIHADIEFTNVAGGEVNATASGAEEFRRLAEQSSKLFASRRQTITSCATEGDRAFVGIRYEAVLAVDLPNGLKAGETLLLKGRSEFTFRDGKIVRITDRA